LKYRYQLTIRQSVQKLSLQVAGWRKRCNLKRDQIFRLMPHREGVDRREKLNVSLEELIGAENPVRVVEDLVESLDLLALGFEKVPAAREGRPAWPPAAI
jgi:hypothetical protein